MIFKLNKPLFRGGYSRTAPSKIYAASRDRTSGPQRNTQTPNLLRYGDHVQLINIGILKKNV